MLEVYINSSKTIAVNEAISEAVDTGNFGTLAEDIRDCFSEEHIEQIEDVLESGDLDETIDNILEEWAGDIADELLDDLIGVLNESGIELQFDSEGIELDETSKQDDYDDDDLDEVEEDNDYSDEDMEEEEEH